MVCKSGELALKAGKLRNGDNLQWTDPLIPVAVWVLICSVCSLPLQTYIGTLLVSVNPYKELGIYTVKQMEQYKGVNFFELPPHM